MVKRETVSCTLLCTRRHLAYDVAPSNCLSHIHYGHRKSRRQKWKPGWSYLWQCCLGLFVRTNDMDATRSCYVPSQTSPWIKHGFKILPSVSSGRRRRGTTFWSVSLQTKSNSGQFKIGFARSITCPRCLVYRAHHESSQISTAWAIFAWQVAIWKPNFPVGDTDFWCISANPAANGIGPAGCLGFSKATKDSYVGNGKVWLILGWNRRWYS